MVSDPTPREHAPSQPPHGLGTPRPPTSPEVEWQQLAAGGRAIVIHYKDQTYHLRETRNGKLILTK